MFVYGTLVSEGTRQMLEVEGKNLEEAKLHGFRKDGLNVIRDESSTVEGITFDATDAELKRLDRYEGVEHNWYNRLRLDIEVNGETRKAYVYQLSYTDEPVLK